MRNKIALTTDAVIFSKMEKDFHVLLIQRKNEPYKEMWALPGGFVEEHEKLIEACQRELKEETSLDLEVDSLKLVDVFDDIKRDPRSRTISIAFTSLLKEKKEVTAQDDAKDAKWVDLNKINKNDLAFDHYKIVMKAKKQFQIR